MAPAAYKSSAIGRALVSLFVMAQGPAYSAPSDPQTACLQENATSEEQLVPPQLIHDVSRIYNDLSPLAVTIASRPSFLLSNTEMIQRLMEEAIQDPEELDDALYYVLSEYKTFWNQQSHILNSWAAMREEERRMGLLNIVIGLRALDQIFEPGFVDYIATTLDDEAAFKTSIARIETVLGNVEMQDFEISPSETCFSPSQDNAPQPGPTHKYDGLLLG